MSPAAGYRRPARRCRARGVGLRERMQNLAYDVYIRGLAVEP